MQFGGQNSCIVNIVQSDLVSAWTNYIVDRSEEIHPTITDKFVFDKVTDKQFNSIYFLYELIQLRDRPSVWRIDRNINRSREDIYENFMLIDCSTACKFAWKQLIWLSNT